VLVGQTDGKPEADGCKEGNPLGLLDTDGMPDGLALGMSLGLSEGIAEG
jgi:hypothetical protein